MIGEESIKIELILVDSLKDICPEIKTTILAKILLLAADKGRIYYDEIEMREDLKQNLLLQLEKERILIPFKTSKTLALEE